MRHSLKTARIEQPEPETDTAAQPAPDLLRRLDAMQAQIDSMHERITALERRVRYVTFYPLTDEERSR